MIGILSSGTEQLNLVKLCQQSGLDFCIIADTDHRPYQDHTIERIIERTQLLIKYSQEIGCTHCLLMPSQELLVNQGDIDTYGQNIISLFTSYSQYCLNHSLMGKIGFVGGYSDNKILEKVWQTIQKSHTLTPGQTSTKKFNNPLSKRIKDVSMREYFVKLYSPRQLLINKTIKEDLRYFKDADVDTLIPLSYTYFNYQRTITSYLNPKKQKFHKQDILEDIFKKIISTLQFTNSLIPQISIYHTGSGHFFTDHKKTERLLSQGKAKTIEYIKINL